MYLWILLRSLDLFLHTSAPSTALSATGIIWVRYSFVIIPVNYSLAAVRLCLAYPVICTDLAMQVNLFVGATGVGQLARIWQYVHMSSYATTVHPSTLRLLVTAIRIQSRTQSQPILAPRPPLLPRPRRRALLNFSTYYLSCTFHHIRSLLFLVLEHSRSSLLACGRTRSVQLARTNSGR